MKPKLMFVLRVCSILVVASLIVNGPVYAQQSLPSHQAVSPVVSTDWLAANSGLEKLVILDIRSAADYAAGHIANAINAPFEVPFSAWITMRDDLLLELPEKDDLFNTLGTLGITKHSLVVVVTVGPAVPPYPLANATRVADTLIYAGVKKVSILDGGYAKWVGEGRAVATEIPTVTPVTYRHKVDKEMFVSIEDVKKQIEKRHNKAIIIDARDADVYNGLVVEPWTDKAGHIPTAKSLPTPLMWNQDGTYKSQAELKEIASAVVGMNKHKEIIVYCGVGGYASSWWFVLTEVLGYKNVKIFDGAAQEWGRYYDMVLD
jgi:thiosulfate/3-mercaptopyruvate sulfurtransferase